jgi:hypothetical protein
MQAKGWRYDPDSYTHIPSWQACSLRKAISTDITCNNVPVPSFNSIATIASPSVHAAALAVYPYHPYKAHDPFLKPFDPCSTSKRGQNKDDTDLCQLVLAQIIP